MSSANPSSDQRPVAGLFVTCLVDLVRPSVGEAAVRLIEAAGCTVVVPETQTCCGQPAYNAGLTHDARSIAESTVRAFRGCDYIVAPSGSCAAMLKHHYPRLLGQDAALAPEAQRFAARVHELTSFLVDVRSLQIVPGACHARAAYHDACSGLRELGIREAPRQLLKGVAGLDLVELEDRDACCGFGGLFSVKYPGISNAIAGKKAADVTATAPDLLLGGDLGCLMNIAGKLSRAGSPIACRHVAEVLAGMMDTPPIAGGDVRERDT